MRIERLIFILWILLVLQSGLNAIISAYYNKKYHAETQALILEYHSKLTAVETEKQKTIADFLRSVKTGRR